MPSSRHRRALHCRVGAVVAGAGVLAIALSGCNPSSPTPSPTPTESRSAEPIFASDEEALEAAEAAYVSFEEVSQAIASESGNQPERIETVASARYVPELLDEFARYRELGIRVDGSAQLDSFSLVEHRTDNTGATVVIYVCRDVNGVRVLDASGLDITPEDRDSRTPLIASLNADAGSENLLVDEVELWSGQDFC